MSDPSITPPSLCLSEGYPPLLHLFFPSSTHPSIMWICVFFSVKLRACVCFSLCSWLCVCVCIVCQITICPPPTSHLPSPPLLCMCVWCESRSVGICWQTLTIPSTPPPHHHHLPPSLPPTHPEALCVLCPSSRRYVPAMPASAQFSSAQLRLAPWINYWGTHRVSDLHRRTN